MSFFKETSPLRPLWRACSVALLTLLLRSDVQELSTPPSCPDTTPAQTNFLQRDGADLMLDGQKIRLVGVNIYWLGLDENVGGIDYPTPWRIDNIFETANAMNLNAIRSHGLISTGCEKCIMPEIGVFQDEGFQAIDYAIKKAHDYGIGLIFPLTDNWSYYHGGLRDFAPTPEDFFSNPQMIAAYKAYITKILTHVNPFTGIAYKDDPMIYAWETGNEVGQGYTKDISDWTDQIARHIRSLDPNHLIIDGHSANTYAFTALSPDSLDRCSVDIMSEHAYPPSYPATESNERRSTAHGKPFLIGELGSTTPPIGIPWYPPTEEAEYLRLVVENPEIDGIFLWSLFGHDWPYGRVAHNDGFTMYFPDSRTRFLRKAARTLQGIEEHTFPLLPPPYIHILPDNTIALEGVVGAQGYTISVSQDGETWQKLDDVFSDTQMPLSLDRLGSPQYIRAHTLNAAFEEGSSSQSVEYPYQTSN